METGILARRSKGLSRRISRFFAGFCTALAAGCAAPSSTSLSFAPTAPSSPPVVAPRPHYPGYAAAVGAQQVPWTARTLADDFVQLMFVTEWGARSDRLRRWESPVRVALVGRELVAYRAHASAIVARLDAATPTLSIALTPDEDAEITVRTAPRDEMRARAPNALCFFAPTAGDWRAFVKAESAGRSSWADVEALSRVTIFIPERSAPYEVRACLNEEIIQALGPGNDLARLEDSLYNDDNAHSEPTAFDLTMLSLLYHQRMPSGASSEAARDAAIAALGADATLETGTKRRRARPEDDELDGFARRRDAARDISVRERWADRAVAAAETLPAGDHRLAEALKSRAYIAVRDGRREGGVADLERAAAAQEAVFGPSSVRLADTRAALGIVYMQNGRPRDALAMLDAAAPILAAHAKERGLAQTLRWRSFALEALGETQAAAAAAVAALDWAAYVFGASSPTARKWRADFERLGLAI